MFYIQFFLYEIFHLFEILYFDTLIFHMNIVRPTTSRSPRGNDMYTARNQLNAIRNSREPITIDEIINLKREKQNLTQERYLLKAKLARFTDVSRRQDSKQIVDPTKRNKQIADSLEKQVRTLENLTAAKRAEINDLIYSDRAAQVTELQEESKMLHLESLRLKKEKLDTEAEIRQLTAELEATCERYSPQVLKKQERAIRIVEKEIKQQKEENEKIKKKIEEAKKQQEEQKLEEKHEELKKQINELRQKIRNEQDEIKKLDNQMSELQATHKNDMLQCQSKL